MLIELPVEGSDEPRRIVAFFCSGCMLVEFLFFFFCLCLCPCGRRRWKGERGSWGIHNVEFFFVFFFLANSSVVY